MYKKRLYDFVIYILKLITYVLKSHFDFPCKKCSDKHIICLVSFISTDLSLWICRQQSQIFIFQTRLCFQNTMPLCLYKKSILYLQIVQHYKIYCRWIKKLLFLLEGCVILSQNFPQKRSGNFGARSPSSFNHFRFKSYTKNEDLIRSRFSKPKNETFCLHDHWSILSVILSSPFQSILNCPSNFITILQSIHSSIHLSEHF